MDSPIIEKTLSLGHYGMLTLYRIMRLRMEAQELSTQPVTDARPSVEVMSAKIGEVIAAEMELASYIYFVVSRRELPDEAMHQSNKMAKEYPAALLFDMEIPLEMAHEIVNANKLAYETNLASVQKFDVDPKTGKTTLEYGYPPVTALFQAYAQEWLRRQGDQRSAIG